MHIQHCEIGAVADAPQEETGLFRPESPHVQHQVLTCIFGAFGGKKQSAQRMSSLPYISVTVVASNDANRFRNRGITVRTPPSLPGTDNGWLSASRICTSQLVMPASCFENNKPRSRSRSAVATAI